MIILDDYKQCIRCGEMRIKFNTKNICVFCRQAQVKQYKKDNKEKLKIKNKEYRERNRDKLKQKHKEYYANNKDKYKKYREETIDKIMEREKQYRIKNRDKISEYNKEYYKNNIYNEKARSRKDYQLNKERYKAHNKEYKEKHKEKLKELYKSYYNNTKAERLAYSHKYYRQHKRGINNQRNVYQKLRREYDVCFRLRCSVSASVNQILRRQGESKRGGSIIDNLQFSIEQLKIHLESQFESWMSWDNWGRYNANMWDDNDSLTWTWNIDHIMPQSKLPYFSMEHPNFQKCWSLENLRPLSAKINIMEGAR